MSARLEQVGWQSMSQGKKQGYKRKIVEEHVNYGRKQQGPVLLLKRTEIGFCGDNDNSHVSAAMPLCILISPQCRI